MGQKCSKDYHHAKFASSYLNGLWHETNIKVTAQSKNASII